ncbi:MAG: acetyl-CoA carboxylase biotin carboxyl carrier protein [Bacteroidetes bacterium]|nr:acetyl-CoA carboxylase biotin carboxyl carrier protein [Bacteroidota bacterium]MCK6610443.1 acetyl-CoA carboxylase biotin carboxyl carrier protein [Bacteroidia bacterium]
MELKEIKELIKLVSDAGVSEVEVERGDFKISIRKADDKVTYVQHTSPVVHTPVYAEAHHQMAPSPVATEKIEAPASKTETVAGNYITIKSPMIGTYYKSPSPDKAAFVQIGDEIKPGQVLCIVEAMKLFNEIESEVSGRIVKILVENASPVEYDQPLFLVEPI